MTISCLPRFSNCVNFTHRTDEARMNTAWINTGIFQCFLHPTFFLPYNNDLRDYGICNIAINLDVIAPSSVCNWTLDFCISQNWLLSLKMALDTLCNGSCVVILMLEKNQIIAFYLSNIYVNFGEKIESSLPDGKLHWRYYDLTLLPDWIVVLTFLYCSNCF